MTTMEEIQQLNLLILRKTVQLLHGLVSAIHSKKITIPKIIFYFLEYIILEKILKLQLISLLLEPTIIQTWDMYYV